MTPISALFLAIIAISAAGPDKAPLILDFHAEWCGPCKQMRPAVERLAREGYPIKSIDMDQSPDLAAHYQVDKVPTFIVVDQDGRELGRLSGLRPAIELAELYNDAWSQRTESSPVSTSEGNPTEDASAGSSPTDAPESSTRLPRPWETVVRIKIHNRGSVGYGSGTIIHSTPEESVILTCAHIFKVDGVRQQFHPSKFPLKIQVDLFDGQLHGTRPAQVHPIETVRGTAIDYDFGADIGLIRITPGRILPATPVVPPSWKPRAGLPMITVGCSEGNDATAWSTHITNPQFRGLVGQGNYVAIECNHAPKQGRSGGGLYTTDGYLAGVCDFAAPADRRGLYAHPTAIHKLLDRNRLTMCYNPPVSAGDTLVADRGTPRRRAPISPASEPATTLRAQDSVLPEAPTIPALPSPDRIGITLEPIAAAQPVGNERTRRNSATSRDAWAAPGRTRNALGGEGRSTLAASPALKRGSEVAGPLLDTGEQARTASLPMDPSVSTPVEIEAPLNLEDVTVPPPPKTQTRPDAPIGGWKAVRRSPAPSDSR